MALDFRGREMVDRLARSGMSMMVDKDGVVLEAIIFRLWQAYEPAALVDQTAMAIATTCHVALAGLHLYRERNAPLRN